MDEGTARPSWWRRRNWWKIGFFVMLVVFEFTREIAVISSDPPAKVATNAYVGSTSGYTRATGRWTRVDGGSQLMPGATLIQCDEQKGQCVETTSTLFNGYVTPPEVTTFDAKFSPEAVNYENDLPECARYSVRIDLKLKKVFALRERVKNPKNPNCASLERRIEMTLGDGFVRGENPLGDHFVPILRGLVGIAQAF